MKITITGHRPQSFVVSHYNVDTIKRIADDIVSIFKREYGNDLIFNLGGAIGTDQWVGDACIKNNVNYHLFLPTIPEKQSKFWLDEQKETLMNQVQKARGLDIVNPDNGDYVLNCKIRNYRMVDSSDFVVAFWVGQKRGGTYNAIKYALSNSKFVFNAMNDLKLIFTYDIKNGWTPPTMVKNG